MCLSVCERFYLKHAFGLNVEVIPMSFVIFSCRPGSVDLLTPRQH